MRKVRTPHRPQNFNRNVGVFYALFLLGFTCYSTFPYTSQQRFWKALIGTEMSSSVVKQDCEPYEYVVKDTGEVITLNHRYVYESEVPTTTQ